jgi:flagellar biosynthesis/type III secretory pathway M-ring protein FliF/YscJ
MKAELAATQSSDKAKAEEQDARMHFPERVNTTRTFKQAEAHRRSLQALVAKEQARADKESSEDPAQRIARVKATAKRANERCAALLRAWLPG